jgi:hypothetical protein
MQRITFLFLFVSSLAFSQSKKPAPSKLHKEIAHQDSILFNAFNTQNMPVFKAMFTENLEWFQDNGGLLSYQQVFDTFGANFKKENKLTRQLVKGSLEVYPIKDYGAIETGIHKFRHMEDGKEIVGTFKFLMIWQLKDGQWKISRVVSYDH